MQVQPKPASPLARGEAIIGARRRWPKPGPGLMAFLFLMDSIARALLSPVIPLEALRLFGSEQTAGLMVSAAGIMGVIATFAIPTLVERWRARRVYLAAIALLAIAPAAMAADGLLGFSAGWFMRSIAAASVLTLLNLYIAAFIPKRQLASSEPLRTFISALAWVGGPWVGVRLYTIDPMLVFGVSGGTALVLLVFFLWLGLEAPASLASRNPLKNLRRYFSQPRLRLAWVLNFGRETWWVMIFNYGPWYLEEAGFPKTAAGDLQSSCTTMLVLTLGLGWVARRIGLRRFMAAAYLIVATAMIVAALASGTPNLVWLAFLGSALGAVSLDSVAAVTFLRAVRPLERPQMSTVFSIYRDAASVVPPLFFSLLLGFFPLPAVFVATGIFLLGCSLLSLWLPKGL
ncbi:MAG TPA: MFS transporter [Dongiaceae bacterium]|jgi:MFS family permease|nr:MFS transporter [Dongiaceae bacterium]